MDIVVTGIGLTTAAGAGVAPLLERLHGRTPVFAPTPPYRADGLAQARCAQVVGLDRQRPAEDLLQRVARAAMADAGLTRLPASTGLVVGTSSGNICGPWERWHRATLAGERPLEAGTGRDQPTEALARVLSLEGPRATVSVACASSTAGFAVALGWLEEGVLDSVLVAGVDALSLFVHAGFSGLGALSADVPRPFQADRDGLLLGEGAAALLLETGPAADRRGARARAVVLGAGLSSDAVHMTAPDREGRGAARAMSQAIADAGLAPEAVDTVSVHGTGTPFNDAMEAHALMRVFGERLPAVHGVKHVVGHTLGAAGGVEAAVVVAALDGGRRPPPPRSADPSLLPAPQPPAGPPRIALSTSSAFGGVNASVVLARAGTPAPDRPQPRSVRVIASARVELPAGSLDWRAEWPAAPDRFLRVDHYIRTGLLAVHRLEQAYGAPLPTGAGVVLSSRSGCRVSDLRYHRRLVERGAAYAPRVAFIATIPGSPAAEAAIHWKLTGPALVLVGPAEQGDAEARRLVRRGRADTLVVLDVEAPDASTPARGRATLIAPGPPWA